MTSQVQIDHENSAVGGEPSSVIFNIMRFSLHDGPGIRTTVFLKGCPLSCWWCHNPESQSPEPDVMYFKDRCRRCGDCIRACPHHAIVWLDGAPDRLPACQYCGTCVQACLAGARELVGRRMTLSQVICEIEKDVVFFDESGGGVTFSGGEPLSQSPFLEAVLSACRERRIHTVLDTCGLAPREVLLRVAAKADLVLYDLKLMDSARHKAYTGASNEPILRNLEALVEAGRPLIVRFPVIPGMNDDDADVHQVAAFLQRLGIRRIDLLPYHQIGVDKYNRLRLRYQLEGVAPPPAARMEQIQGLFTQAGFAVKIGG